MTDTALPTLSAHAVDVRRHRRLRHYAALRRVAATEVMRLRSLKRCATASLAALVVLVVGVITAATLVAVPAPVFVPVALAGALAAGWVAWELRGIRIRLAGAEATLRNATRCCTSR